MNGESKPLLGLLCSALASIAAGILLLFFSLQNSGFAPLSIFQFLPGLLAILYRSTGKFKVFSLFFYVFGLLVWIINSAAALTSETAMSSSSAGLSFLAMVICIPTLSAGAYFVFITKKADVLNLKDLEVS